MSDSYRCSRCGGTWFKVSTTISDHVQVTCDARGPSCDHFAFAPTVAEAFQAISQGEKKEKADGQA